MQGTAPPSGGVLKKVLKSLPGSAKEKRHHGQNQEHNEKDLADADRPGGNAAKAEESSDQGDHKENNSVVQHGMTPWVDLRLEP